MNEPARTMSSSSSSSRAVDYEALEATTSIEDITEDELNREILRSLSDDDAKLSHLRLCSLNDLEVNGAEDGDYHPGSSEELGWLGHFAKKSTRFEGFCIKAMRAGQKSQNTVCGMFSPYKSS